MNDVAIELDIIGDYALFLRYFLVHGIGFTQAEVDKLSDDESVMLTYFRIQRRLVAPDPRTIHKAHDFSCPPQYADALQEIERKIAIGESINHYLSRKLARSGFNDLLLNDWGIHHLHLGTKIIPAGEKNEGFIEGTKALLYVYFDANCAYFVKILETHDFAAQILLQTMHDNWPHVLAAYHNSHITGDRITDKEIKELRRKQINFCIALDDGTAYISIGGGITASGDNAEDVFRLNKLHHWAAEESKRVRAYVPGIVERNKTEERKLQFPMTLRLKILDLEQRVWVLDDDVSGLRIPLRGPWT